MKGTRSEAQIRRLLVTRKTGTADGGECSLALMGDLAEIQSKPGTSRPSDRCDRSKMALMVAAFAADLSKAAACAHLAAGMVSAGVPMLRMVRAVAFSLLSLTRRIGTAGHRGAAKAYAVQHHRKRRQ